MKKIIFLISLIVISLLSLKNVTAKTQEFYQGEYINNIFIHKTTQNNSNYYGQARFIRKVDTNEIAYCIEPTVYFQDGFIYEENSTLPHLTSDQILDMTLISHFGYGYANHTDPKWYPITQTLIWEIADPSMKYHMTTSKNPYTNHLYTTELEEIRNLVRNYKKSTSLNNKTFTIVEGETLTLTDTNQVLTNYTSKDNITIKNNTITINNLKVGTHTITLEKEHNLYNRHPLFYTNKNSQDVMDVGDPTKLEEKFNVKVINTELKITKVDSETKEEVPQGDASLTGAIFAIYKNDNTFVQEFTLDNTTTIIKNLPIGAYYFKEIKAGSGYQLNNQKYHFTMRENSHILKYTVSNQVIKGKLIIHKEYGTDNNFHPEANISFNIYHNNKLIKTITTNEEGFAEIDLPYGKYKLVQLTTTEGYQKIEPIEFEIATTKEIIFTLKDYKIDVPNTKTISFIERLIIIIKNILCGKN